MHVTRRTVLLGLTATLAGCQAVPRATGFAPPEDPPMRAVPNPEFDAWVAAFRDRAAREGIARATIDAAFRDAGFLPGVIEKDRNQVEFDRTLEDYLAIAASDERIETGRKMLRRHARTLEAVEARFGVERQVVTAVWGLESKYGARKGDIPVISALATLAYDGRRGAFFERQLIDALRILENGDTRPASMTGSWAGAMGHTQFMPSSYLAYAVDFTGDGRRDIWGEDPADALASTAAYLSRFGWRRGQPWGMEVRVPDGFDSGLAGRGTRRSAGDWAALGVRDAAGGRVPDHGPASVLLPMGPAGPAFMAFRNFGVIARYNNAESYVIGVGHLADRLRGGPPIRKRFPPDRYGMTIDDRKALQRGLTRAGYDTQGADGVIGPDTEAAIRAYQQAAGLPPTGEPSLELLRRLR